MTNAPSSSASIPAIETRGLTFAYPGDGFALREMSFSIAEGEIVGVVGPSGAGKSTLLMHLNGLLPHKLPATDAEATVFLLGTPLTKQTIRNARRDVGLLFQDPDDQLFCPTVREDVAFGPLNLGLSQDEARARMREALEQVGLANYERRSTIQLSLGERRRVCLAGVLACRPRILALDEPFSNLDPRARNQLCAILRQFSGTQVIASHDLDLVASLCTRVLVLDEGLLRADGPAESILRNPVLMARHGLEVPWRWRPPPEITPGESILPEPPG